MKHQIHARLRRPATPLTATAVGAALLVSAFAAQAQATTQTVTVTGIRKSIEDAISVKRNADGVVEAVSAEDIGKLPDASVAESISRLPGVAMQRSSVTGKPQDISVRGMSPDFNGGTLNGREQASTGGSRGVQFDQFPAELMTGITIYKTPEASLLNQGLSSTIDMSTARPLNFSERLIRVSGKVDKIGKSEDLKGFRSGDGERLSLSYVDQFADRTAGIVLGATHSRSKGSTQPDMQVWGGWTPTVDYNGQQVAVPGGFTSRINNTEETRDALLATLQFKPSKDFETTLDVMWSKGKTKLDRFGLEGPLGGLSAGANDSGGRLINATIVNGVATSGTFENWKGVINNHFNDYTDELQSLGWNLKGKAGAWTLTGDLSHSENKRKLLRFETTLGIAGNAYNANDTISFSGFNGSNHNQVKYTGGLDYTDPNLIKLTDVQGWAGATNVQDGYYANPVTKDRVQSLRFGGKRDVEMGWISRIDLGGNYTERSKTRVTNEGALVLNNALDANGNLIDRLAFADVPGAFIGYGGTTGIPTLQWNPRGSLGPIYTLDTWTDPGVLAKNWGVKEKVGTAFARGDIDASVGDVALRGNVGLQFVRTDVTASGLRVDTGSCNGGAHSCTYTDISQTNSYNDVLPSMNLAADLGGDQVMRLGVGKVISRPAMEDMRAGFEYSWDATNARYTGSGGNPKLKPFKATALDLSYEKYFGKKGYVSVAGFYKDLDTYILRVSQSYDYSGLLPPGSNAPTSRDLLTRPINGQGGSIRGFEVAVNVPLSLLTPALDGFGVLVNHSDTKSALDLSTAGFATSNIGLAEIPLPGLSRRVTNLRAYYENHGWQFAVASRSRSAFLGTISDFQDNNQLVFIKGETTVDVQAGYEFQSGMAKGLSLMLQGYNVTNAPYVELNPANNTETVRKKFGAMWSVVANYKF
ncbi:MAG: TonB-dependent receptor [Burkholderiales bacterium]|nr:TonB-dependent receptor [Burkholderiales bacterium]